MRARGAALKRERGPSPRAPRCTQPLMKDLASIRVRAGCYLPRFARTESLACLAMRNFSTRFAGIEIASPVAGLRPMRALRSTTTSLPTPGKVKPLRASLYASIASSSRNDATCFFGMPVFSDNRFRVSDFVIPATSSSNAASRAVSTCSGRIFAHAREECGQYQPHVTLVVTNEPPDRPADPLQKTRPLTGPPTAHKAHLPEQP